MSMSKHNKIYQWLNYRMKVTIQDNRTIIGTFLAFDKHMNLVLADAEEFRIQLAKKKGGEDKEERRSLGLTLVRGECVISLSVDGPPPADESARQKGAGMEAGPGLGRAAGRGVAMPTQMAAAPGLAGPARGVGAAGMATMTPQGRGFPQPVAAGQPMAYGRGGPPPPPPSSMGRGVPGMPPGPPMGFPGSLPPHMMPGGRGFTPGMPPYGRGGPGFYPPGAPPPGSQPPPPPPPGSQPPQS